MILLSVVGLVVRLSPEDGANGDVRTLTSSKARSGRSSLRLTQSSGPTTTQRTVVRPIWTKALPLVQVEFVSGESWTVIRRISFALRPSLRRLDRERRSALRNELIRMLFLQCTIMLTFVCL